MKKNFNFKKIIVVLFALALISVIASALISRSMKNTPEASAILPAAKPYIPTTTPSPTPTINKPDTTSTSVKILKEVNLAIPFIAQAPKKIWDKDHEDFCEEAALLMAMHYINGTPTGSLDKIDADLYKIKDFEMKNFGYFESTDVALTSRILTEHLKVKAVATINNPSINDIKKALSQGKAVVVPAAGRMLKNPHFKGEGPLYHMFVIKGYTADGKFITNDPGTQFGKDYLYPIDRVMNAIHDWNGGNVMEGKKVVIVVG